MSGTAYFRKESGKLWDPRADLQNQTLKLWVQENGAALQTSSSIHTPDELLQVRKDVLYGSVLRDDCEDRWRDAGGGLDIRNAAYTFTIGENSAPVLGIGCLGLREVSS